MDQNCFRMNLRYFLLILFASSLLYTEEPSEPVPLPPKYNLSICAIFKNEAKYLKEWIEFHRLIGVDHFYLCNNNSTDNFKQLLRPYTSKGVITLIPWPDNWGYLSEENGHLWTLGTQIPAYEYVARFKARNETKWL